LNIESLFKESIQKLIVIFYETKKALPIRKSFSLV